MPRKSKEEKELERQQQRRNKKIFWTIMSIVVATLLFFTLSRMGILGNIINNCLTYIAGSFYIVPLLTMFGYAIFVVFFEDKYRRSFTLALGLIIFNLAIMILGSFISNKISDWNGYVNYTDRFLDLFKDQIAFDYINGGLIGEGLYLLCINLVERSGVILVMISSILIALILIIPFETYKNAFNSMRDNAKQAKEEKNARKQEELINRQKAEEERKQKQAEEMARLADIEDAKTEMQDIVADEIVKQEEVKPIKKVDTYSTDSPFLINLTDSEIASGNKNHTVNVEKNREIITEEPSSQKILKVKNSNGQYKLPKPLEKYLDTSKSSSSSINKTSADLKGKKVIEILGNFGIEATLLNTYIGPSVTKFEIKPDSSVKINKINNISDNIKMELAAKDIRIEAPIPGRSAVGIEIPNVEPIPVKMYDLMKNIPNDKKDVPLLFCLGKDLMGKAVYCEMTKMPHLLIAGATGSGKSVCINSIITSVLLRTNPDDVKLVLVDPKKVEFTPYKDIPHLLWPIIDDATMASNMLKKIVVIMEERYDLFAQAGVRNIQTYNDLVVKNNSQSDNKPMDKLPYILVIIDELADLMAIAGKDVEQSIQRITQLARASGIHLIVATQRPSTDVITGLIKSNIPSRISFAVASSIDSRTILDSTGAERLLGNGDMLYHPQGENALMRLQGVYVKDDEISKVTEYVKSQAKPQYEDSYYEFLNIANGESRVGFENLNADITDSLYDDVVEFVRMQQKASTSLLQRRFGIGYNRAARLIDTLEDKGIIGPSNGSKAREVYLSKDSTEDE